MSPFHAIREVNTTGSQLCQVSVQLSPLILLWACKQQWSSYCIYGEENKAQANNINDDGSDNDDDNEEKEDDEEEEMKFRNCSRNRPSLYYV